MVVVSKAVLVLGIAAVVLEMEDCEEVGKQVAAVVGS